MPISDSEIIKNIRGGAKHDYALLIDRYKDRAMTLAVRMLKNRQDAEEALQDAFIRAYNALERFEGAAKFSTWFYRIVYNVCLTRIGKRKEEFQSIDFEDGKEYDSLDSIGVVGHNPDYETQDMIQFIKNIMETLPEKYATILSLFYLQDLSHDEICEVTQLPLGTVKVRLFRARALLHDRLHKEFQSENIAV